MELIPGRFMVASTSNACSFRLSVYATGFTCGEGRSVCCMRKLLIMNLLLVPFEVASCKVEAVQVRQWRLAP
jgi:hypothetical protein